MLFLTISGALVISIGMKMPDILTWMIGDYQRSISMMEDHIRGPDCRVGILEKPIKCYLSVESSIIDAYKEKIKELHEWKSYSSYVIILGLILTVLSGVELFRQKKRKTSV